MWQVQYKNTCQLTTLHDSHTIESHDQSVYKDKCLRHYKHNNILYITYYSYNQNLKIEGKEW